VTIGEGRVTLTRAKAYVDKVRAYKVLLDGQSVGRIKEGETQSFSAPAGPHQLQLKVDWAGSPTFTFDLAPGDDVRFICRPKANAFTAILYSLFARNKYLLLVREGDAASDELGHPPNDRQR
jgi:hypothetical protein